jgi:hypothetical protein
MSLDKAMKNLKFDTRMIEYNINNGLLTKEELQKHIQALQDIADQSETLNIEERNSTKSESH